ncbi:MAG: flagellar motor switch protein FliG [Spirochaetales bacterium]|jgi:flagellar motor switch protein FliG|nr:flagellar motor switch protein FliG [Spirochaetales bacterium]
MDRRKKISDLYKKTMRSGSAADKTEDVFMPVNVAAAHGAVAEKALPVRVEKADAGEPSQGAAVSGKSAPDPAPSSAAPGFLKLTGKRETSVRKAAKFLMLIGRDEAAGVMRHFTPEEAQAVAREIAGIRRIENAEAEKILGEFGLLREALKTPVGGVEAARSILVGAFGEERGREILFRSIPSDTEKFFSFLEGFQPQQLQLLFRKEPPEVLAIVMPYLDTDTASKLLPLLGKTYRRNLIQRMAKTEKISRDVLVRMEDALRERARKLSAPTLEEEMDGKGALAEILKYVDIHEEEKILKNIEEDNPVIAGEIKERLFTIDVLDYMEDTDLQKILRDMMDQEIALLLKGKSDSIRAKILMNVSARRRDFVADEYRLLGAVPRKDVDTATRDFLNLLKRLQDAGDIIFRRENDVWV